MRIAFAGTIEFRGRISGNADRLIVFLKISGAAHTRAFFFACLLPLSLPGQCAQRAHSGADQCRFVVRRQDFK
jgi:hypothetical protein